MAVDLEQTPDRASDLCRDAHQRLWQSVSALSDDQVRAHSRLAGWTVGHVLTHLARNADAHARVLQGALLGEDRPKYGGGTGQRSLEIDQGATRRAEEILHDLETSQARLEAVFEECSAAGWPNPQFVGGGSYGPHGCPAHRLRETEMHHVDLGLGYEPSDWPDEYVAWELPVLLSTVDERLESPEQRRSVVAWLAGRGTLPHQASLALWGLRPRDARTPVPQPRDRARVVHQLGAGRPGDFHPSAEDARFELARGCPQHAFQACAIGQLGESSAGDPSGARGAAPHTSLTSTRHSAHLPPLAFAA